MENDVLTRNENEELAVRVVSATEQATVVNPDDVYTRDTDGNLAVRVVGAGGDSHNKGYFATQEALEEAYPTAEAGDYAIVGETDTVWVWDEDSSAWVDTDTKGEVTPDMVIIKSATMPSASTTPAGAVYQYVGTTNSTYTHGYIYENKATSSYSSTVEFNPASISGTTATCSGQDFADLVVEFGSGNITDIIKGTLTYDESGGLLVFVGQDDTDTQICTFQLYTQDYEDAGFTFTGTLQDGDVITFTCTITETETNAWERIDVQPAPTAPVSSVNTKTGAVVLDATDVGAVPQYEEVPTTTSADVGKIFQFAGEYDTKTGYCQNGQFYKVSNTSAFRISINQTVGTDLGLRFPDYASFDTCVENWFTNEPAVNTFVYNGTAGAWYYTPQGEEPTEIILADLGLVCDGTPVDGDTFVLTGYNESYPCENIRVEEKELPDYNGLSGTRYLIANGGDLYWHNLDAITNESNKTGTVSLLTGSTIGTGTNSTVIGVGAIGTTNGNNTAIGSNASALNNGVAIGCNVSATGIECITIGYNAYNTSSNYSIMMGRNSNATGGYCIGIGNSSSTSYGGTAVGYSSQAKYYSVALGQYAKATNNGIAIGSYQTAGSCAISIGSASNGFSTNSNVVAVCAGEQSYSNAGTIAQGCIVLSTTNRTTTSFFDNLTQNCMYIGLNGSLYKLVDENGNIPVNRIASTTGLADGVYVLKMTIVDGVKTLSWVLES